VPRSMPIVFAIYLAPLLTEKISVR
jgi:hypothetical protein